MITAEILTIGAELLQGHTLNANSHYLSGQLKELGASVKYHTSCDDVISEIVDCLRIASGRADVVIVTGGLGPTPDDVTREAVSRFFNSKLIFHEKQYRFIAQYFKKLKRRLSPITQKEAFFPEGGVPILNPFGIALGFFIKRDSKLFVVLPGVPRELKNLFTHSVRGLIKRTFRDLPKPHELTVNVIGLDEAEMMSRLGKDFFKKQSFEFGSYPLNGRVLLRIKSHDLKVIRTVKKKISRRLSGHVASFRDEPLEQIIGNLLRSTKTKIALAESCTGGLLSKVLTDAAGASKYYLGGVISYANQVKTDFLKIDPKILKMHGAVSKPVAIRMAANIRKLSQADIGISITGIAGPAGGTRLKPVGLVWIAVSDKRHTQAHRFQFAGERDRVRRLAAQKALLLLFSYLTGK